MKKGSGNICELNGIEIGSKTSERSVYTQSAVLSSSIYDHMFKLALNVKNECKFMS